MDKPKILIADPQYDFMPLVPEEIWVKLSDRFDVVRNPYKKTLNRNELIQLAQGCVGVVAGIEPYDEEVFASLNDLKVISRTGAGLDSIDLNAAARHGVTISDCAGATTEPVAELTVGLMISLLRKINSMNHLMHQGKWEQKHGELLQGKTVGIVGMGRIGRRVASLLRSFDCQILGCDLNPDREWFNGTKTPLVSPEEIWTKADIISIHVYLAPENVHMLGEKEFSMMKSGVYFLNLSRGPVVDEKALIKFLNKGNFSGVALDVFENEPYQGQLSSFENVILLPHVGASTEESRKQMELGAIEHLLKLLA